MRTPVAAVVSLLYIQCVSAASAPGPDQFNAPPFCPTATDGEYEALSSSVFVDDTPEFLASELRARHWRQYNEGCRRGCPFDKIMDHHREKHYKTLDRVVIMDMTGLGPLNGIGNTLGFYTAFLKQSIIFERAAFLRRNAPECELSHRCSFDPGDFFIGRGGIDWRWTNDTACAVARAMALRGEREHVFSLVFNKTSQAHEAIGAFDETTGEFIEGDFEFFSLLSHSAVKKLPWIRFLLPPDARPDGPGPLGWNMEHVLMSNRGPPPTDDLRIGNPDLYREVCLADAKLRAHVDAGGEGPKADLRRCGIAAFLYPSPRLQHLVAPLLPAIDDTRRRCGALVGVHLRSGFADLADYIGHNLHPPPPGAPGANGTAVPETAAEAVMNAWAILSNATRPCPQRCHVGKPPDPMKSYVDDHDTPGCAPDGQDPTGDICMDWKNNQHLLWTVGEVQANHDARIAARKAAGGGGAGGGGGQRELGRPLRFDIDEGEIGAEIGLVPAILTVAAWEAERITADRSVITPFPACSPYASPAPAGGPLAPSPPPPPDGSDAWRVFVAGDLPLLVATAHASPSLRGRVIDAGRAGGAIGHVNTVGELLDEDDDEGGAACQEDGASSANASSGLGARCTEAKARAAAAAAGTVAERAAAAAAAAAKAKASAAAAHHHHGHRHHTNEEAYHKLQGAWSRSVVDVYLLSVSDYLVSASSSSFFGAATLMQIHDYSWLGSSKFLFFNRLRMSGHYVKQREGEEGWGLPLYASMADAIQRLEAVGLGGSGVL